MPKTFASLTALIVIVTAATAISADGKPVLVSVVGKDLKSTMGELGRENDANIEVFDLRTGQGQVFKKADLQTISKDVTEASAIDRVGLSAFMAWRIKKVLPISFATGKIAQIDGKVVYVSIGSKVGIEEGQELTVYRGATEIRDPDTGEVLGKQRRKVAKLEAIEVNEKLTKAKLIGDLETSLQVGDIVEPTVVSNSVAVLPLVNHKGHETIGTKRIAEELVTGLVNREISVIERRLLDKVLGELSLQQGSGFDTAKAQKVGKQLGAYAIVIGSVTPKAKFAEAQLRLVRVETGEIMVAATQTFREVGDLLSGQPDEGHEGGLGAIPMIDRNSLKGWFLWTRPNDKNVRKQVNWQVADGVLTNTAAGQHLVSERRYKDFELEFDFQVPPKCNSGIYLRGRYELKLKDASDQDTPPEERCGAIHRQIAISEKTFTGPKTWNTVRVVMRGKQVTVVMNGKTIIDRKEVKWAPPSAFDLNETEPGPILLHSHPLGAGIKFRHMSIKEL